MDTKIQFKPEQTILFIGDSITDCDRTQSPYQPLGRGYVNFAANFLLAKYPRLNIKILNRGVNGDTTRALKWRWQRDCINEKPDILSIMIGINDLWWAYSEDPSGQAKAVAIEEYRTNYQDILLQAEEKCRCQIILMEPFMFCSETQNPMYKNLKDYIRVVHNLAKQFNATMVPLQQEFEKLKDTVPPCKWADDMVHPYTWAHAWIAQKWLKALDVL
jgi:lysophospholipase L1-like esterase